MRLDAHIDGAARIQSVRGSICSGHDRTARKVAILLSLIVFAVAACASSTDETESSPDVSPSTATSPTIDGEAEFTPTTGLDATAGSTVSPEPPSIEATRELRPATDEERAMLGELAETEVPPEPSRSGDRRARPCRRTGPGSRSRVTTQLTSDAERRQIRHPHHSPDGRRISTSSFRSHSRVPF